MTNCNAPAIASGRFPVCQAVVERLGKADPPYPEADRGATFAGNCMSPSHLLGWYCMVSPPLTNGISLNVDGIMPVHTAPLMEYTDMRVLQGAQTVAYFMLPSLTLHTPFHSKF